MSFPAPNPPPPVAARGRGQRPAFARTRRIRTDGRKNAFPAPPCGAGRAAPWSGHSGNSRPAPTPDSARRAGRTRTAANPNRRIVRKSGNYIHSATNSEFGGFWRGESDRIGRILWHNSTGTYIQKPPLTGYNLISFVSTQNRTAMNTFRQLSAHIARQCAFPPLAFLTRFVVCNAVAPPPPPESLI